MKRCLLKPFHFGNCCAKRINAMLRYLNIVSTPLEEFIGCRLDQLADLSGCGVVFVVFFFVDVLSIGAQCIQAQYPSLYVPFRNKMRNLLIWSSIVRASLGQSCIQLLATPRHWALICVNHYHQARSWTCCLRAICLDVVGIAKTHPLFTTSFTREIFTKNLVRHIAESFQILICEALLSLILGKNGH